jgi:hypothetical protein
MNLCFCFRFGQVKKFSDKSISSNESSSSPQVVDLLQDEGTDFQEHQWQILLREKLQNATSSGMPFLREVAQNATLNSALESLTLLYQSHGFSRHIPMVTAVLQGIQPFASAITSFTQPHPEIASLVWGSFQLILQVSHVCSNSTIRRIRIFIGVACVCIA